MCTLPPTRSSASRITRSSTPPWMRVLAAAKPATPAPMITTLAPWGRAASILWRRAVYDGKRTLIIKKMVVSHIMNYVCNAAVWLSWVWPRVNSFGWCWLCTAHPKTPQLHTKMCLAGFPHHANAIYSCSPLRVRYTPILVKFKVPDMIKRKNTHHAPKMPSL